MGSVFSSARKSYPTNGMKPLSLGGILSPNRYREKCAVNVSPITAVEAYMTNP